MSSSALYQTVCSHIGLFVSGMTHTVWSWVRWPYRVVNGLEDPHLACICRLLCVRLFWVSVWVSPPNHLSNAHGLTGWTSHNHLRCTCVHSTYRSAALQKWARMSRYKNCWRFLGGFGEHKPRSARPIETDKSLIWSGEIAREIVLFGRCISLSNSSALN